MGKTCIFLIHGITKTNKELEKIASFLNSNKIKTITPLLPGHGTCPYDRETCFKHFWKTTSKDWFKYAEREFLKCRKKFDKIYVGGVSLGGNIAIMLASKHKHYINGLILIGTPIFLSKIMSLGYCSGKIALKIKNVKNKKSKEYHGLPIKKILEMKEIIDESRYKLKELHMPVIIFQSKKDDIANPKSANYIFKKIKVKHKKLIWFNNEVHGINTTSTKSSKFMAKKILEFIKQS